MWVYGSICIPIEREMSRRVKVEEGKLGAKSPLDQLLKLPALECLCARGNGGISRRPFEE